MKNCIQFFNLPSQEIYTFCKVEINCERLDNHLVTGYNKFVGMEQPELKPVEHALVDDRIP
jgi:hypothetical protein